MKPVEIAKCLNRGREFRRKTNRHKYCHWQCASPRERERRKQSAASEVSTVSCEEKVECFYSDAISEKPRLTKIPRGRYVYAWLNDDSPLPFYVGKGVGERAWRRHVHEDGRSMWCQQVRASSRNFRVIVVRENLTNEGAMLLESSLIAFIQMSGGVVANQIDPLRRQERPPLVIDPPLLADVSNGVAC